VPIEKADHCGAPRLEAGDRLLFDVGPGDFDIVFSQLKPRVQPQQLGERRLIEPGLASECARLDEDLAVYCILVVKLEADTFREF
jgi:hypothetical protein